MQPFEFGPRFGSAHSVAPERITSIVRSSDLSPASNLNWILVDSSHARCRLQQTMDAPAHRLKSNKFCLCACKRDLFCVCFLSIFHLLRSSRILFSRRRDTHRMAHANKIMAWWFINRFANVFSFGCPSKPRDKPWYSVRMCVSVYSLHYCWNNSFGSRKVGLFISRFVHCVHFFY